MRNTLITAVFIPGLALGLAYTASASDPKTGQPVQPMLSNTLASNNFADTALKQFIKPTPDPAYAAITAALQLNPEQAEKIVSAALSRHLNPAQVVAAALRGTADKAGIIVLTAILKSPGYYTVPVVQRALAEGADGSSFLPQAMRTSPQQAATILAQALRSAPQQTTSIMEAVIAAQPDKAAEYVKTALDAKASTDNVLAAALKVAPGQAEAIAAITGEKGISSGLIVAATVADSRNTAALSLPPQAASAADSGAGDSVPTTDH